MTKFFIEADDGLPSVGRVCADAHCLAMGLAQNLLMPALRVDGGDTIVIKASAIHQLGKCIEMLSDGGRHSLTDLLEFWLPEAFEEGFDEPIARA